MASGNKLFSIYGAQHCSYSNPCQTNDNRPHEGGHDFCAQQSPLKLIVDVYVMIAFERCFELSQYSQNLYDGFWYR